MKSDLDILPADLKAKSISSDEVVLDFNATIRAISFFREKQIALLGSEAWIQTQDGSLGHSEEFQGTVSLERRSEETWQDYVKWTTDLCEKTIREDYQKWNQKNETKLKIFFCLSPISP
jgi:hypothetical protein